MNIDELNPYDRKETTPEVVLIQIWDDLGNLEEKEKLNCEYCKKLFNYLNKRYD